MKKKKKAQVEILGLMIVMVLIALGVLFAVKYVFLAPKDDIKQEFIDACYEAIDIIMRSKPDPKNNDHVKWETSIKDHKRNDHVKWRTSIKDQKKNRDIVKKAKKRLDKIVKDRKINGEVLKSG